MKAILISLIFLLLFDLCLSGAVEQVFNEINAKVEKYNSEAAKIAWEYAVDSDRLWLPMKAASFQKKQTAWRMKTCDKVLTLMNGTLFSTTQRRQTFLLCRGPMFTFEETRIASSLLMELQAIYSNSQVCIPTRHVKVVKSLEDMEKLVLYYLKFVKTLRLKTRREVFSVKLAANSDDHDNETVCMIGEEDIQDMMRFSKNEEVLRWLWLVWREKVGPSMKEPYAELVQIQNRASVRNGYQDIGAAWREEYEISNLRPVCRRLYEEIKPLYTLLHGVVRFFLRKHYGDIVPEMGPIPAHLLGDLWAQNWQPISDLILQETINLDESIRNLNWTVYYMVRRAEDFYRSLGLPAMTETFWRESVFAQKTVNTQCHGTSADMFEDGDYRILYCSGTAFEDFYVLHHEMGHIEYFMAYKNQPALFRQANAALHETIGDTIMYGVMTPQHLHRLGLINDSVLYTSYETPKLKLETSDSEVEIDDQYFTSHIPSNAETGSDDEFEEQRKRKRRKMKKANNENERVQIPTDYILLVMMALNKLPQIPFALLMDEFRWQLFEGRISEASLNKVFWELALDLQGIVPPEERGEEYFDMGAKFHVPDNTPFIRYFLSSFLQHQLFESLCKAAVFGRRGVTELPKPLTLNRCDIYGSKIAGKILKDLMSRGNSQNWQQILLDTIGEDDISASALIRYYEPLQNFLNQLVTDFDIPIGW